MYQAAVGPTTSTLKWKVKRDSGSESERAARKSGTVETSQTTYRWRKRLPHQVESVFSGDDFPDPPSELPSPGRYFRLFFDHALFEKTTEETNLYSTQVSGKSINTTAKEIEQFIGIFLMMGIVKYSQFHMYWAPHTKIQ